MTTKMIKSPINEKGDVKEIYLCTTLSEAEEVFDKMKSSKEPYFSTISISKYIVKENPNNMAYKIVGYPGEKNIKGTIRLISENPKGLYLEKSRKIAFSKVVEELEIDKKPLNFQNSQEHKLKLESIFFSKGEMGQFLKKIIDKDKSNKIDKEYILIKEMNDKNAIVYKLYSKKDSENVNTLTYLNKDNPLEKTYSIKIQQGKEDRHYTIERYLKRVVN